MDDNAACATPEFVSLISDLTFSAKVRGAAATLRRSHANYRKLEALMRGAGVNTRGVVVDLGHPEATTLLHWMRSRPEGELPVLAFFPHVEKERGDLARAFSFVQVTTRSKFDSALVEFLSESRGVETR